jgi:hypothetical protein
MPHAKTFGMNWLTTNLACFHYAIISAYCLITRGYTCVTVIVPTVGI